LKEQTNAPKNTTYQTLRIKDGVERIHSSLRFGGVANKAFSLSEGNVRGRGAISLVVRNDFDTVILPNTDATVGRAKVNAYRFSFRGCHG